MHVAWMHGRMDAWTHGPDTPLGQAGGVSGYRVILNDMGTLHPMVLIL